MAIAFPRSLRALSNDRFRPSLLALGITSVLLLAWLGWFFFGSFAVYENSETFTVERGGNISVTYPATSLEKIKPDQKAVIRLSPPGETSTTYNGKVYRVEPARGAAQGKVDIYLDNRETLPTSSPTGQVQVQVESVSPASLVLRAVRQSAQNLTAPTPVPTR